MQRWSVWTIGQLIVHRSSPYVAGLVYSHALCCGPETRRDQTQCNYTGTGIV